jgi:hypothetical protein
VVVMVEMEDEKYSLDGLVIFVISRHVELRQQENASE